jgi:RHS repeat-associated protein
LPKSDNQGSDASSQTDTNPKNLIQPPTLSLFKGGGAIRGIEEKFQVNPVTGTNSLSIPLTISPGRSGFTPQLNLSYDSGAGNGPFGLGWNLSLASISRKTSKALPRYLDNDESDIFVLSGAEDLVPLMEKDLTGYWLRKTRVDGDYRVFYYRPRTEGSFAHIEKWVHQETREVFWKTISRDNVTTYYGRSTACRVVDPKDSLRIFSWLIEEVHDDKGNIMRYEYKQENQDGVEPTLPQEKNRLEHNLSFSQQYLKRVWYGNKTPYQGDDFLFEAVFDYGEHGFERASNDRTVCSAEEVNPWVCRHDSFATYKPGFEIRTYRLCQRVLMFHHFAELDSDPYLVKATEFSYDENPVATMMEAVTHSGYIYNNVEKQYQAKTIPPMEFKYTQAHVDESIHTLEHAAMENIPVGLNSPYQWIDLDGEGISGVLVQQPDAWYYKRNLGQGRFTPLEKVGSIPKSNSNQQQLKDIEGNGSLEVVLNSRPTPGYYSRKPDQTWDDFQAFQSVPNINWQDPNLRVVDLTGDGQGDVLITEDTVFVWYASAGKKGYTSANVLHKLNDEEQGPALVFADKTGSIFLADMSGDGLQDIVRIRNGEICYWPNLGYAHFGPKVSMDQAPVFDQPGQFDPARLRLADVDGSGTADIIYLGRETITYWINQAGNCWSLKKTINQFPQTDNLATVSVIDLLGQGTACLVWSSPLSCDSRPMQYIDLMGGQKPYLLTSVVNNMGAETRVQYAPSTKFYLEAKAAGTPWITKLPFPVQVVESVERFDYINKTRFVNRYAYHHGYYDQHEREFRGFGLVEQWDTECYSKYSGAGLFSEVPETAGEEFHLPPVYTKTWIHTGAWLDRETLAQAYAKEYYQGDTQAKKLVDTIVPPGLSSEEEREACRVLKGTTLRKEIYALDETTESTHPYTVTEGVQAVKMVQPKNKNKHAVFMTHALESISYHYERDPFDPRVTQSMTLDVDHYGTVLQSLNIHYPRRNPEFSEQATFALLLSEVEVMHMDEEHDWYRLGVPVQSKSFDVKLSPPGEMYYSWDEIKSGASQWTETPYEAPPELDTKRVLAHSWTLYSDDDMTGPLGFRELESLAIPYESYQLAFTPGVLHDSYGDRVTESILQEGGYVEHEENWWVPSGRQVLDAEHFYSAIETIDQFGKHYAVTYDPYTLGVVETKDPLGNITQAQLDYRALTPWLMVDMNNNRTAVKIDELGLVIASAVMGKEGENEGDTLDNPTMKMEYELFNWMHQGKCNCVHTQARETHQDSSTSWKQEYAYSNGFGKRMESKVQAAPGLAPSRDANGELLLDAQGALIFVHTDLRWIGNGKTIFNNKGNPIKQYELFFSGTHEYEAEQQLVQNGVTAIMHYDPLGRLIRTDLPDGTLTQTHRTPWQIKTWDANDMVEGSQWQADRLALSDQDPKKVASLAAAAHANTPTIEKLDAQGRVVISLLDNGAAGNYASKTSRDITGNPTRVQDARQNTVEVYAYDIIGQRVYLKSMDADESRQCINVKGQSVIAWDSREHTMRHEYDALQRPTKNWLKTASQSEVLVSQSRYGEDAPDAITRNLRGSIWEQCDQAGKMIVTAIDYKGNTLTSRREVTKAYKTIPNWAQNPDVEGNFENTVEYDALDRITAMTLPDHSIITPEYNESGLLSSLHARIRGGNTVDRVVDSIVYNARGQRERITYGNTTQTEYTYDPLSFRLTRLCTTRTSDQHVLQDAHYIYDPVGNITHIQENAQQTIYFNNAVVRPDAIYTYDALYRLVEAKGREHGGQGTAQVNHDDSNRERLQHPHDGQAMQQYTEHYEYDEVGNLLKMIHQTNQGNWSRRYQYANTSNRLLGTSQPGDSSDQFSEAYAYNTHGSMTQMPHLQALEWNFKEQLQSVDLGGGGKAYYVYAASGQRARKVVEKNNGTVVEDRLYLGGFERFKRTLSGETEVIRESVHLLDGHKRIAVAETKTYDSTGVISNPQTLLRFQYNNHLGTASLELSKNGDIISYEEYHPFGTTAYQAGPTASEVSLKRYRYVGKERDEETGFYYHGARYYAPWLGRWTSADPSHCQGGLNLYRYSKNNPIRLFDPDGKDDIDFNKTFMGIPQLTLKIDLVRELIEMDLMQKFLADWNTKREGAKSKADPIPGVEATVKNWAEDVKKTDAQFAPKPVTPVPKPAGEEEADTLNDKNLEKGLEKLGEAAAESADVMEGFVEDHIPGAFIGATLMLTIGVNKTVDSSEEVKGKVLKVGQVMRPRNLMPVSTSYAEKGTGEYKLDWDPTISMIDIAMGILPDDIEVAGKHLLTIDKAEKFYGEGEAKRFSVQAEYNYVIIEQQKFNYSKDVTAKLVKDPEAKDEREPALQLYIIGGARMAPFWNASAPEDPTTKNHFKSQQTQMQSQDVLWGVQFGFSGSL